MATNYIGKAIYSATEEEEFGPTVTFPPANLAQSQQQNRKWTRNMPIMRYL